MKIGVFTNNYLPAVSGVGISIENFRVELTKLGHQVFIFAPNYKEAKTEKQFNGGPENIFRFPSLELGKDIKYYSLVLPFTPKIDHVIKGVGLDIIHSQHPYWVGQIAMWYAKRLKLPLVFTYHTLYEEYSHYVPMVPQPLLKWYLKKSSLEYALKSDAVVAPSQSVKQMLESRIEKYISSLKISAKYFSKNLSVEIVPSGINMEKFNPPHRRTENRKTIREKYGITDNDIALLCICRLAPEKNLDFLIRSLASILNPLAGNKSSSENVYLMLVGGGSYKEYLAALAREFGIGSKIKFVGPISNDRIADYYKAGDVFVYSSLTETQGIVLIEALASGLPVAAVDASGSRDVITNDENGFLTKNDAAEFREKVRCLINDLELRKKFSQAAFKTANNYSIENCTQKLLAVYEKAIERKKSLAVLDRPADIPKLFKKIYVY